MNTAMVERTDQDYADFAFAFKCIENGEARAIRKRAGMSQYEMAERVGVHQPYITNWERGSRLPLGQRRVDRLEPAIAYGRILRELSEATDN